MSKVIEEAVALKKTLVVITVFGLTPSKSVHESISNNNNSSDYNYLLDDDYFDEAYTLNTSGCTTPKITIEDPTIRNFIHYPHSVESCSGKRRSLLQSNQTHIWIEKENFINYDINNEIGLKCCYRSFHRSTTIPDKVLYLDCMIFNKTIKAIHEFVKVECYYYDNLIHWQFFLFLPKKQFSNENKLPLANVKNKTSYNVIIMGLSSVSRLQVQRTMPKTVDLLEELGAIELIGYHSVGDGMLDNILPILANMISYELNVTCWPHTQDMIDVCPFIWEMFKQTGFITALVQDTAQSELFNPDMYSLSKRLPDYCIHHFLKEIERNEQPHYLNERRSENQTNLRIKRRLSAACIEDKYHFKFILDYMENLVNISRPSKLFGLFWESSLSWNLNAPMLMDEEYENVIQNLNNSGYLDETVLILLSDEGMAHGDIQTTKQGRLEQRLPLASILVPPTFREHYSVAYENLKTNSERLTTPFDLHETLIDLINLDDVENNALTIRTKSQLTYERGVSLFMSIPSDRTCESAGIFNHWCTCHKREKINVKRRFVRNAVGYVIAELNRLLQKYPQCARVELESVIEFEELWPSYRKEIEWREFRLEMRLKPGAGEYEAFLRHDKKRWSLMTYVRRLDVYNASYDCGTNDTVKWYCQCKFQHFRATTPVLSWPQISHLHRDKGTRENERRRDQKQFTNTTSYK